MGGHGAEVRCLTSVFVPSELRWLCVFSADDESVARMTAEMAQIPERYLRRGVDVMSAWVHGSELLGEGGVR